MRSPTALCLLFAGAAPLHAQAQPAFPADSSIERIVAERGASGRNPGVIVGVLDARGPRFFAAGTSGREGLRLDEHTAFEIGSITKVFTGIALASLAVDGSVALDDPVARHLPDSVHVPDRDGAQITLRHLSTHTSGLPRLPSNLFPPARMDDPYASYGTERLYAFLNGHTLQHVPGARSEYSNVGVGLLGHALARRAGTTYEQLVRERILRPLGMDDSWISMSAEREAGTAVGHDALGRPVAYWSMGALEGAGALRSTAADLLRFSATALDPPATPLGAALALAAEPHDSAGTGGRRAGLGWGVQANPAGAYLWHNGGTGGFRSFLALHPASGRAVVVLTNSTVPADDVGLHLLDGVAFPLPAVSPAP